MQNNWETEVKTQMLSKIRKRVWPKKKLKEERNRPFETKERTLKQERHRKQYATVATTSCKVIADTNNKRTSHLVLQTDHRFGG